MTGALLEIAGLHAGYGSIRVLWGVDLAVRAGETVVLLGPNGAGKTTLLKCLAGLLPARGGTIGWRGEDIARLPARARVRRGLCHMSELGIFPDLTIAENLDLGALFVDRTTARRRRAELYALFPILAERRRAPAGALSGGQRKMLGIARALAAEPALLAMDEPSAGLSPKLVGTVIDSLARCRAAGLALLIAEQNVRFLDLADTVYTLEGGRAAAALTPDAVRQDDRLRRAYFGMGV